ncbi:TadE/TadG family type IV pilus assembly protein [Vitiosangium sp. GDMCC 1.1324]|uniref:TadE/TadG family type IV pilus assembly protein n=1 Tax=Vitiosangium sp. (strain GDMCC 1.1324) TaxID=2138576 RepID=UPI000D3D1A3F|nr:TadE/TadG family type IV pilus assembly protein [Vitiosangium sp. GDMCC 1.1324]PTL79046.1 pilus assembly protein TadE [Vitiosangium sp. GDMCC 1.1324]
MESGNRLAGRQSGQAAVEAALTLPLSIFLILGTLQLFLLLQARVLTEYAAFRAVRTGSVKHGDCEAMTHAAIAALLPTFARTDSPMALGTAFRTHRDNYYHPKQDTGHTGTIVWIARERPLRGTVSVNEEEAFDDVNRYAGAQDVVRLEARLIFWFPMRIPFANWVLGRMFLAHLGLREYSSVDPLQPAHQARWTGQSSVPLDVSIREELLARAQRREYAFPLQATYAMRMMTPARLRYFRTQNCPLTPEGL